MAKCAGYRDGRNTLCGEEGRLLDVARRFYVGMWTSEQREGESRLRESATMWQLQPVNRAADRQRVHRYILILRFAVLLASVIGHATQQWIEGSFVYHMD